MVLYAFDLLKGRRRTVRVSRRDSLLIDNKNYLILVQYKQYQLDRPPKPPPITHRAAKTCFYM